MTTKTFISELWDTEVLAPAGVSMSQVNNAILTATSGLLKLDGTRSMTGSLNLDSNKLEKVTSLKPPNSGDNIEVDGSLNMRNFNLNNIQGLNAVPGGSLKFNSNVEFGGKIIDLQDGEIINTKRDQSDNALATVKSVRKQEAIIDSMFEKVANSYLPVLNQICTASSSYTGVKYIFPDNVFDGNLATEWITNTANSSSWLQIELPSAIHIWKVKFSPRLGNQKTTHIFTNYSFLGSNDGTTYDTLLEHSLYPIDQSREFEIGVTKPYKFFKFEGTGNAHFGLSEIDIYQAKTINKQYIDDNYVSKSLYNIEKALPGIPVLNGMTMMFVPSLQNCTIDSDYKVTAFVDPIANLRLTGTNLPTLLSDGNNLFYILFNGNGNTLFQDNIQISSVGGANGNTTTFFFIANTKMVKQQFQFCWAEQTATGFNNSNRFSVHLPWATESLFFDYGKFPSGVMGRVEKSYAGQSVQIINKKVMYTYKMTGTHLEVFLNGIRIVSRSFDASLSTGVSGRFALAANVDSTRHCSMDFYGLYFYNRALSDVEIAAMHLYIQAKYKII